MLLEEGASYEQCVLLTKLLAFALLHLYSKAKTASYSSYLLTSYFCIPMPYMKRTFIYLSIMELVLQGLVGFYRIVQF